ncbi:TPA: hypothetical protein ITS68_002483 [Enterococcus faecalis]|uniref:hypothetical protein n=1 Tax=Enterococcus faecalis TaxID=1351 RepID=UPI0011428416|nr:hypothetical protein [Enterococcus faecalis]MCL4596035.1 hypothetical protein [Enterococcus faecalis]TQB60940.1 hypothetical protein FKZ15_14145 [Enterococcus faecalis]HAP2865527.1 hypothetical protein [Enterococcus faecalis]HAP3008372.1 hypothetical protein [Enterococcus faecalis]
MDRKIKYSLFVAILFLLVSLIINVKQFQNNKVLNTDISITKKENSDLKSVNQTVQEKETSLQQELDTVNTRENNSSASNNVYKDFEEVTNKVFEGMYNFNPDNYKDRKKLVKGYLSEDLYKKYYQNKSTIGDSGGVTSKLLETKIYVKTTQKSDLVGLVYVESESQINDSKPKKIKNYYEVTYDTTNKKIKEINNQGQIYHE